MKKYDTKLAVHIGENSYPIYLTVKELDKDDLVMVEYWESLDGDKDSMDKIKHDIWNRKYDLRCKHEIYAMAWYDIYIDAIRDYENGRLEEVIVTK